ncbi:MAG TPA: hypothetical protein VMN60_11270 [Longimicrobiales bacterium]|nr:hypothetical protein [Longimicrobiales bacterium]
MKYTEQADATLDAYVERVRRSVAGRADVDEDEVVSGIREHMDVALTMRGLDRASAEDVLEVLAELGRPDSLTDADATQQGSETPGASRIAIWAALALAMVGLALLATSLMPVGLALLAMALIATRVALEEPVPGTAGRLATVLWALGVVAMELCLLLGPAVLVWASAQTGGVLEDALARYTAVSGSERPGRYWVVMAATAGGVTGVWWMLLALITRTSRAALDRALGPARPLVPRGAVRALAAAGAALLGLSLLAGWLS